MSYRNAVKVCVRTRPTQNFAQDNIFIDVEHSSIMIKHVDEESAGAVLNNRQNSFKFKFDHVFHNASQSAVYDLHARDTVHDVVDGVNGAILSYGQTGSGKTFTMIGDAQSYEHRGVAPRAITQLFNEVNSRVDLEFQISCTYMEIYNERVYDLLLDVSRPEQSGEFTIVEEKDGKGIFVRGLTEIEVRDEAATFNLLFTGGLSKTVATHKLNRKSNRSHSIFTLYLQQRQRSGVSEKIVHSKLHLVDLAGSERLKKTMDSVDGSMGDEVTRKESMAINRSLTYLEQCVVALTRKGQTHVPYRQSKLTNILKDCLGANCNTVMLACIWGESTHLEETISTLRLASRMMKVQNETVSVESVDPLILVKRQEKIINALKQELLMHDALVERTGMVYDSFTPEQQAAVSQQIEKYVSASEKDEDGILHIDTYRQMLEICKQFKKKLIEARQQTRSASSANGTGAIAAEGKSDGVLDGRYSSQGGRDAKAAKEVGEKGVVGKGFALGETRIDARPSTGVEIPPSFYAASPKFPPANGGLFNSSLTQPLSPEKTSLDLSIAKTPNETNGFGVHDLSSFEQFMKTQDDGRDWMKQFNSLKSQIKELKQKVRTITQDVNDAKAEIDRLNIELDHRKTSRIQSAKKTTSNYRDDIVDDDELTIAKSLKETKQKYRNNFEQMQKLQNTLNSLMDELEGKKSSIVVVWKTWQQEQMDSTKSPSRNIDHMNSFGSGEFNVESDELDDQEAFDKLERERVMSNDPDSLAFFTAQKTRRANLTQSGGTLRMMQKNKLVNIEYDENVEDANEEKEEHKKKKKKNSTPPRNRKKLLIGTSQSTPPNKKSKKQSTPKTNAGTPSRTRKSQEKSTFLLFCFYYFVYNIGNKLQHHIQNQIKCNALNLKQMRSW